MDPRYLPLIMMILFFVVVIVGRVSMQLIWVGNSGIRPGGKLKTPKEICISYLMFGTLLVQLFLSSLYAASRIDPLIALGSVGLWVGVTLCIGGILFTSYCQFAMGGNWRIGVDPDEETELVTSGIYSKIRNPIYTGCIAHGVGMLFLAPNVLVFIAGFTGLYAIRAYVRYIEEPYLIKLHGDEYVRYMECTGSFLPNLRKKPNLPYRLMVNTLHEQIVHFGVGIYL